MSIHISKMTGKLQDFFAINTNTVTNEYCIKMNKSDAICKSCYSMNMLKGSRKNCQPAFERNSKVFVNLIPMEDLPVINAAFFRFHGHGELINFNHMINFHNIAEKNKHCTFSLWTKRKDIIKEYRSIYIKPNNLILIYSNPIVNKPMEMPPLAFNKVFNVVEKDHYESIQNCTGQKCIDCLKCYRIVGPDVITEAIKKRS